MENVFKVTIFGKTKMKSSFLEISFLNVDIFNPKCLHSLIGFRKLEEYGPCRPFFLSTPMSGLFVCTAVGLQHTCEKHLP